MAQYYSKSTLTICAASVANCDGGLFQQHTPCHFDFGPIQPEFKSKSGQLGHIYLAGKLAHTQAQEPLTTRAWTFQETMLSQRMLIFGTNELYWSCKAEKGSRLGGLYPQISGNNKGHVQGVGPLDHIRFLLPSLQWSVIISNYSSRLLGFPADRLPAISSLASVLQDGSDTHYDYSHYKPMVYVAGLYITPHDTGSWIDALLWNITATTSSMRSQPYRSPSWSWASVDGQLSSRTPTHYDRATDFAVDDYEVILNNKLAPYGMMDDAFLSIRARCRTLKGPITISMVIALDNDDDLKVAAYEPYVSNPGLGFIVFYPDTLDSRRNIEEAMNDKGVVLLVEMVKLPLNGLVLYPVNSQQSPPNSVTYERIGCFTSKSTDRDWWKSGNKNREEAEAVFGAAQVQSLRSDLAIWVNAYQTLLRWIPFWTCEDSADGYEYVCINLYRSARPSHPLLSVPSVAIC